MPSRVTIDGAGRLVIPRDVRRRLHLHAGTQLELVERGSQLVLEPVAEEAPLLEQEGLLLAECTPVGDWTDHRDLREERAERLGRVTRSRKRPR